MWESNKTDLGRQMGTVMCSCFYRTQASPIIVLPRLLGKRAEKIVTFNGRGPLMPIKNSKSPFK